MSEDHGIKPFKFHRSEGNAKKKVVRLARTDRMIGIGQILVKGGENNLHSHDHLDGFWFVLSGRVKFYGKDDVLVGEFGPREGVLIPRTVPYWFESVGEEELELLQVEAFDIPIRTNEELAADRINHRERKAHNTGPDELMIVDGGDA
jgi:mannose-6-phosphate isomerase-like protein (cupin superfamily)